MFYLLAIAIFQWMDITNGLTCKNNCPMGNFEMACGFIVKGSQYKMFPSKCALDAYKDCHQVELKETPVEYCIKEHKTRSRKMYDESCPVFCPSHYRPVCGASKMRSYIYRTFNNGCYLDMLNCRGDEDFSAYVEVPLEYCQRHSMKNIFKEQLVITNLNDMRDY